MNTALYRWCKKKRGNAASLAREVPVAAGDVSDWIYGRRAIPAKHCPKVAAVTGIKKKELRPHDFALWGWHDE